MRQLDEISPQIPPRNLLYGVEVLHRKGGNFEGHRFRESRGQIDLLLRKVDVIEPGFDDGLEYTLKFSPDLPPLAETKHSRCSVSIRMV